MPPEPGKPTVAQIQKSIRFTVFISVLNAAMLLFFLARALSIGGGARPAVTAVVLLVFGGVVAGGIAHIRTLRGQLADVRG